MCQSQHVAVVGLARRVGAGGKARRGGGGG